MVLEDLVVWALFSATAVAKAPWACKDTSTKRLPLHWLFVSSQRVVRGRAIFPAKYVVQAEICTLRGITYLSCAKPTNRASRRMM